MVLLSTERAEPEPSFHVDPNARRTPPDRGDTQAPGRIGRYLIINKIGQGGMGVVYSAYDPELDRRIALKLLANEPHRPNSATRLLREARSMARLSHPNVVSVYDAGTFGSEVYIAMEFVRGHNLRQWLHADRPPPWRDRLQKFVDAGRGLASAHALEIVHRDFKPDNVLVRDDGRVQVADFGLAKQAHSAHEAPLPHPDAIVDAAANTVQGADVESSRGLTAAGHFVGTPAYMSPEQIAGRDVGPRSDQFSFCVALYEALYGTRPFAGESAEDLFTAVLAGRVRPPPRGSPVPGRIFHILRRGMATDPALRYPTMEDLLRGLLHDPGRRAALLSGAVVALAAVGALSWTLWASRRTAAIEADRAAHAEESARDNEQKAAAADRRARDEAEHSLYRARSTLASVLVGRRPSVAGALLWTIPAAFRDDHWRQAALDVVHANHPWWTITVHPEQVDSFQMLSRSNVLLSASDGVIYRHDLDSRTSAPIHEPRNMVNTNFAISADETLLAAAWPAGEIRIWSLEDTTAAPQQVYGHKADIKYLDFSRDGQSLIGGFVDGRAHVWDLRAGTRIGLDAGDVSPVIFVASASAGSWLTVTRDGVLTTWSATGTAISRRRVRKRLWDATLARDQRSLAAGYEDATVCIWDVPSLTVRRCFGGHTSRVDTVRFADSGDWLLSTAEDGTARVWDLTGRERHVVMTGHMGPVNWGVFMNGDTEVLTAGDDETVRRWRRDGTGVAVVYRGHDEHVVGVTTAPNSEYFATASSDHSIAVWRREIAGPKIFRGLTTLTKFAEVDPRKGRLVMNFEGDSVGVWDPSENALLGTLEGHSEMIWTGRFSPDGRWLATGAGDGTARIWDIDALKQQAALSGHARGVLTVAFSPDGDLLATGDLDGVVRLWRPTTGDLMRPLPGHTEVISSLNFSPDGQWLVTGSHDTTVRLWDLSGTRPSQLLEGHTGAISSARFAPDSRHVVSAAFDNTARIWSLDGVLLHELREHQGAVLWAEFDPSGQRIVTASEDGTVRIWDAGTGVRRKVLRGHATRVRRAEFDASGRILATGSYDHTARVWDLEREGSPSIAFRGHTDGLWWARPLPAQRLLTFSLDGSAAIWDARVDLESLTNRLSQAMHECPSIENIMLASGESNETAVEYREACQAAIGRGHP